MWPALTGEGEDGGFEDIHMPRVTRHHLTTIWQQEDELLHSCVLIEKGDSWLCCVKLVILLEGEDIYKMYSATIWQQRRGYLHHFSFKYLLEICIQSNNSTGGARAHTHLGLRNSVVFIGNLRKHKTFVPLQTENDD